MLAAVAAVRVAEWAALPTISGKGCAGVADRPGDGGSGGRANSGVSGPAGLLPEDVIAERTGDADESNGVDANSSI